MADYVIGDLQGCFSEFSTLLQRVDFNPSKDHLYLVGDIVARGPDSLACLDYIYQNQDSITITLGNHDLHMIACYYLNKPTNPKDKLSPIFNSHKLTYYIEYLQTQPLALYLKKYNSFISHAGLNPDWSIENALKYAQFAQSCYQSNNAKTFFEQMYKPHPVKWHNDLDDFEKFRYIVNYFTRMRFLTSNNQLELSAKGATINNNELTPWFMHPNILNIKQDIIFGHWAALEGNTNHKCVHALDTGCVWGNSMTLMKLPSKQKIVEKSHLLSK
ncbi:MULTISPECIES: symmetrical bis(5'-nucleosyl)-tetraphosphatase [Pseudoalteromonas]|uniref:bis(5'-nucleosyl)-tetraphosphatase (symmetrical) n=1 Tax=Pseudoalteromonas fuliginea TaxID=1872678 RepID=A0ABD3YE52_9GAMM|nr:MULTISPECIES: symmetrical bis(5'-nucleosyl)-tetraphosphatase [Pseudoalteromonas]ALQ07036.1 diadenosine tetraphosphatase [Pseudoalteromonas sp. Bsw20308]KDC53445.1 diadenosine tetraphosphatase [Pseudoalteromonas fuliginea]KJZ29364.1 diadenosine tetraphosphatase [Pseudoalteromonas fuliginea]